jgi:hypothetical protein
MTGPRLLVGLLAAASFTGCGPAETAFSVEAALEAGKVTSHGETGLPDGAQLNLSLEPTAGGDALAVALPRVKGGRWSAVLDPRRPIPSGAYIVRARFSPRAFAGAPAVRPFTGENGDKLGGPNVQPGVGFRYLEIKRPLAVR